MEARDRPLFLHAFVRYLFATATVASTFALRLWLIPWTGTDAPFLLFLAAVLLTSLAAGIGPGVCAIVISAPLASYAAARAGHPPFQAAVQGLLFALDGIVVVYLTFLLKKDRQAARMRARELIELAPDAFFQADLDARFTDVNAAACRLLGYDRHELIGKTVFDITPVEDAA